MSTDNRLLPGEGSRQYHYRHEWVLSRPLATLVFRLSGRPACIVYLQDSWWARVGFGPLRWPVEAS